MMPILKVSYRVLTTAPYIQSKVHILHDYHIFWRKIWICIFCPFWDVLCTVNKQQKTLAGLAGWVKLSRLRLKTESLVARPAKPVAESNTTCYRK
jgi:hypothetical protein